MKDKYIEAINETVLKAAFEEAAEREIAEIEALDIEIIRPSEEQRREIEREIRRAERKQKRGEKHVWRAVATIAIVFSLTCGIIMMQPTIRASVWDVVVSFFEKYLSFDFDADEPDYLYEFGDYTIGYVPNGYELVESQSTSLQNKLVFEKAESDLSICLYFTEFGQPWVDIEECKSTAVNIGDKEGYYIYYSDSNKKELAWGDDTHTFVIRGTVSEEEMMKIAKNIK